MTMFYEKRDLILLEEKRIREIVREVIDEREDEVRTGFIRSMSGDLVPMADAMKGPPVA